MVLMFQYGVLLQKKHKHRKQQTHTYKKNKKKTNTINVQYFLVILF